MDPEIGWMQHLRVAGKRCARRVEGDTSIGPLIVVGRVALRRVNRLRAPRDSAEIDRSRELVPAAGEAVAKVNGTHVGAAVQIR